MANWWGYLLPSQKTSRGCTILALYMDVDVPDLRKLEQEILGNNPLQRDVDGRHSHSLEADQPQKSKVWNVIASLTITIPTYQGEHLLSIIILLLLHNLRMGCSN
jgi:hypothetical protein